MIVLLRETQLLKLLATKSNLEEPKQTISIHLSRSTSKHNTMSQSQRSTKELSSQGCFKSKKHQKIQK